MDKAGNTSTIAERPERRERREQHRRRSGRPPHIFVVNHDPDFLEVVRTLLEEEQYRVTATEYGPSIWEQAAALQPALLLIDLTPYSRVGRELLERLHAAESTAHLPLLVTSTEPHLLAEVQQAHDRYGGDRFLAKPLDVDALLEAIRALIGPA